MIALKKLIVPSRWGALKSVVADLYRTATAKEIYAFEESLTNNNELIYNIYFSAPQGESGSYFDCYFEFAEGGMYSIPISLG